MRFWFLLLLGAGSGRAVPVNQAPLAEIGRHAGPHGKAPPFTPEHRDPYDKKVDSIGEKLEPLPWVGDLISQDPDTTVI